MRDVSAVQGRIRAILGKILDVPADSISSDAHIMRDLGADSWQYLEFRTELERVFHLTIPDAEVDRLATVAEAMGLITEYQERDGREAPRGGDRPVADPRAPGKAGHAYLAEDGSYHVEIEVGMSMLGRNNLAESPLMNLLYEIRENHIHEFTGVPSRQLADEAGDRVRMCFYYVRVEFPRQTPMASFGENDRLTAVSTLQSYGKSVMDGYTFLYPASWPPEKKAPLKNGSQAAEIGIPYIRSSNIFVKRRPGPDGSKKSWPTQEGINHVPQVAEIPDTYLLSKKASEQGGFGLPPQGFSKITPEPIRIEYQIEPDRDLNEVGLLRFASYCMIQDVAERRSLPNKPVIPISHDLLDLRTVVYRETAYLAEAHQSDSILVAMDVWMENPFLSGHPAPDMAPIRLFLKCEMTRRSDEGKIVVSSAEKVIFGRTLGEAGFLPPLERLAEDTRALSG